MIVTSVVGALGFLIVFTLNGLKGSIASLDNSISALRSTIQTHGERLTKIETRCSMEHDNK